MDRYAENEKRLNELHKQIVSDILVTLKEKGYGVGSEAKTIQCFFKIEFDRLLIKKAGDEDYYHTDKLSCDYLLVCLKAALQCIPKYN